MTNTETFQTFGDLLRFLRKRVGITLRELGQRVAYSETHLARLEANKRVPDPVVIRVRFLKALDLSIDSLYAEQLLALARQVSKDAPASQPPTESVLRNHRLPRPITTFIGRAQEIATLTQLLSAKDGPHLITLTGSGGVGKTRLAIELARQLTHFVDGVYFVELASLLDATQVDTAIATALNLHIRPGMTARDVVISFLSHKKMLLIIDNCEHVIDICAILAQDLLERCEGMRILATSREPLHIAGEMAQVVPPLIVPNSDSQFAGNEAVTLFENRARLADPTFQIIPDQIPAIGQICRNLDGIPLALEMAAAQLSAMTLDDVASGLVHRFELLTRGSRTALPRQQTLHATLDWSYNLLTAIEQIVFARLAVFQGGWTMSAAQFVCANPVGEVDITAAQVRSSLLSLVHKSLVTVQRTEHGTRYRFLETIRAYAQEQSSKVDASVNIRERHLACYVALAEQCDWTILYGAKLELALDAIDADYENIRAACGYSREQAGLQEQHIQLVLAMCPFHMHRGWDSEMRERLAGLLAIGLSPIPYLRAKTIYTLDFFNLLPIDEVDALRKECLQLCNEIGNIFGTIMVQSQLAWAAYKTRDYQKSIRYANNVIEGARQLGNPYWIGEAIAKQAMHLNALGESTKAVAALVEAYEQGRHAGQNDIMFRALIDLTQLDIERALEICETEVERQRNTPLGLASALQILGRIWLEFGKYDRAETAALECLSLWRTLNIQATLAGGIARAFQDAGMAAWFGGQLAKGQERLEQSIQAYREVGHLEGESTTQVFLGYLLLESHKPQQATTIFLAALDEIRRYVDGNFFAMCIAGLAQTLWVTGSATRAATLFGAADSIERQAEFPSMIKMKYWQAAYRRVIQAAEILKRDPVLRDFWQNGENLTSEQTVMLAKEL